MIVACRILLLREKKGEVKENILNANLLTLFMSVLFGETTEFGMGKTEEDSVEKGCSFSTSHRSVFSHE